METLGFMAIDQYGQTFHIGNNPPRKWLLNHLDRRSARKMYIDDDDGKPLHVGYIISGLWLRVYRVAEWQHTQGA